MKWQVSSAGERTYASDSPLPDSNFTLQTSDSVTTSSRRSDDANEPPVIPVGLDAYRQWERWPYQRIGARAYMRSTYDRRGGNEGADASHFLYQLGDEFNVTLDVAGRGVLYFARYNHWHGSPWHYEVDGVDHVVQETGTADPAHAKEVFKETVFLPETLFPNPLACYFPMPFFRSATFELVGADDAIEGIRWRMRHHALTAPACHVGYFHATYRDHPAPESGQDLVLLDTGTTEGGGEWSGSFVGSSWIFSHRGVLNTLEGDPRFFFDDSETPQAYGTGTEEWGGGGDYWGGLNMTLPLAGHPCGARSAKEAKCDEDLIESAYRFLLADLMPFGRRAVIRLEHGGENQSTEHYETVAYWYGAPAATLVPTDTLKVGDAGSERGHRYESPQASEPYEIASRYEWGPDTLAGREIYAPHTDVGRKTTGTSEFTLKLDPQNFGVLLRRKLDYSFPNQRAEVFVADADGAQVGEFRPAGVWYLAGGNTCVYSNPKEELGATQHIVQTSNRRFRDDEFIVPRALTRGRTQVRVRVRFTPVAIPLFPGRPLPELAWSEIRYSAYCWVLPPVPRL